MKCPRCNRHHSWSWSPDGEFQPSWDECDDEHGSRDHTEETDCDEWHVAAEGAIKCKGCGGKSFEVAEASYHTFIRCPVCKWEATIHEG